MSNPRDLADRAEPRRKNRAGPARLIRSPFAEAVVAYARERGVELLGAGTSFVVGGETTPDEVRRLVDRAAKLLSDPLLGLHVAEYAEHGRFGVVEYAARSAATLRGALEQLVRHGRLINPEVRFAIEPAPSGARFSHRIAGEPLALGRHGNEFTIAVLLTQSRRLARREVAPRRVWLAHAAPPERALVERFFGTPEVVFGAADNAILFGDDVLDMPVASADPGLLSVLQAYARTLAPEEPGADDLASRVRSRMRAAFTGGQAPAVEPIAAALRMSARTLQRRLTDEGTSFAALLDEERCALAQQHVAEGTLPLGEVAYLLGYSDPRAFARAFRRWTGKSPGAYRSTSSG
jgi:AraC-like DNA-binding protein